MAAIFAAAVAVHAATVPYFPSASDPDRQGFVRVINHSAQAGEVSIEAVDDAGMAFEATLPIEATQTKHFNSDDLEFGNAGKGLVGIGSGTGDWRLTVTSDLRIEALAYVRTREGFVTSMQHAVPRIGHRHRIATFNPASNLNQVSELRLANDGDAIAEVHVLGIDGNGAEEELSLDIPARRTLTVAAQDLESGLAPAHWPPTARINGALGDRLGKWQLILTANAPLLVMNLMSSPGGEVSNLSALPDLLWRGLVVAPEARCAGGDYDRDEYGSGYSRREDDIVEALGGIYGPYTGTCFDSTAETDIEHIVALHEAHTSGMCRADRETKRAFAGDLLNLTLAAPAVNSAKGANDAFDWSPAQNRCWFANRVLLVKLKYGLTVDREEAEALELVLAGCASTALAKPACAY